MKKIIILLVLLLSLTGCTFVNIEDKEIDDVILSAIESSNNDFIESYNGYKFKVPQGFEIVGKKENNIKLLNDDDTYFMYIDLISKYYKKEINHENNKDAFFTKDIVYNNKKGYIDITEREDRYYIKAEYNYAKIEASVEKRNLNEAVYSVIKMLASVDYNDLIINTMIGENALSYQEEEFDIFESKREESYFMDYVEEYSSKEKETIKDEDIIK